MYWSLRLLVCLLVISISYMNITFWAAPAILLFAANLVTTEIRIKNEAMKFSLFSTMLLFLMPIVPIYTLMISAIVAALFSSINKNILKSVVNISSFSLASLLSIHLYSIHHTIIGGILAAGFIFEIVNALSLVAGIGYFGKDRYREIFTSWRQSWYLGLIAPVSALILILLSATPLGLTAAILVFAVMSKPHYYIENYSITGVWNFQLEQIRQTLRTQLEIAA